MPSAVQPGGPQTPLLHSCWQQLEGIEQPWPLGVHIVPLDELDDVELVDVELVELVDVELVDDVDDALVEPAPLPEVDEDDAPPAPPLPEEEAPLDAPVPKRSSAPVPQAVRERSAATSRDPRRFMATLKSHGCGADRKHSSQGAGAHAHSDDLNFSLFGARAAAGSTAARGPTPPPRRSRCRRAARARAARSAARTRRRSLRAPW